MYQTQKIGDVSNINWIDHDGVNIGMINDLLRNRFYENILRDNVYQRPCIDIGFGTGLLSMLALKHGAKHILAFESDPDRFLLGQQIIEQMSLQHKIELVDSRFTHEDLQHHPDRLIFTETVNGTLFQEGLINSLPRHPRPGFLPARYSVQMHCIPVSQSLATAISNEYADHRPFDPGIDIDQDFVSLVNKFYINSIGNVVPSHQRASLTPGIWPFAYQIHTAWGYDPHLAIARTMSRSPAGYEIDAESCRITTWNNDTTSVADIDFDQPTVKFSVDIPNPSIPVCLVPRAAMCHGDHVLMLDDGHWGPMPFPVMCLGIDCVEVTHDLISGDISYQPRKQ